MSGPNLTAAVNVLPREMQTLFLLASAPNATHEMQIAAAKSITEGTPIGALRAFMYCVIKQAQENGGHCG